MLGFQITTPGFGRENSRIPSHILVKDYSQSLLHRRHTCSPDSHLTCLVVMSLLIVHLLDLKALLTLELISEELCTAHCERILFTIHDHPPEMPLQPNAANAAKLPQTTSPSRSQRSMANSMAYSGPNGLAEYSVQWLAAKLTGLDLKSQSSNGSAVTQAFVICIISLARFDSSLK